MQNSLRVRWLGNLISLAPLELHFDHHHEWSFVTIATHEKCLANRHRLTLYKVRQCFLVIGGQWKIKRQSFVGVLQCFFDCGMAINVFDERIGIDMMYMVQLPLSTSIAVWEIHSLLLTLNWRYLT